MSVPKLSRLRELRFNVLTEEETRRQSVTRELFDPSVGLTYRDGLSHEIATNRVSFATVVDPRMGFDVPRRECKTCMKCMDVGSGSGGQFDCPGHFGHVDLCSPQIWLLYSSELVRVLESICPMCSRRVSRIPCRVEKQSRREAMADDADAGGGDVEDDAECDDVEGADAEGGDVEDDAEGDDAEDAEDDAEGGDDPEGSDVEDVEAEGSDVEEAEEAEGSDVEDAEEAEGDADGEGGGSDWSDLEDLDVDDLLTGSVGPEQAPTKASSTPKAPKKKSSSSFYLCDCFDASVRFKYYCKTQPDDRARYMEVKVSARTTSAADARGRTSRVEVSQKFIVPTTKIYQILQRITRADFRQIFQAQHKDFPRGASVPYAPTDLLLKVLPVIPTVARPSKKLDNKTAADVVTCQYNRVVARNNALRALLAPDGASSGTVEKKRRKNVVAVTDDIDATGQALLSHMGPLLGIDERLTMLCADFWSLDGVPVGRIATKHNTEVFRADRSLSTAVSAIVDKSGAKGSQTFMNLLQRLQGKSGRFRGNLAGKRVNYTARTVITPDETIELDEVSVPYSFARSLTIPVRVTSWNVDAVRDWVRVGDVRRIVDTKASGEEISIWCDPTDPPAKRELHAKEIVKIGIVVHRYLQDGDPVIMNRQPTLHKPSMQVHRVKIRKPVETGVKYFFGGVVRPLPDGSKLAPGTRQALMEGFSTDHDNLTFGLNLSVTRPYNADFDGDEMNMHVCQTLEARAEEHVLMRVDKQLGCRFIGIVQDTLMGAYLMSSPDAFLTEEFATWVFAQAQGKYPDLRLPPPAILKPRKMWTGKQILSMVFQHFADDFHHGTPPTVLEAPADDLFVYRGNVVSGRIKKMHFGEGGQVFASVHTNFGSDVAARVINHFQAIVNPWVLRRGISVGIKDCVPSRATQSKLASIKASFASSLDAMPKRASEADLMSFMGKVRAEIAKTVVAGAEASGNRIIEMARAGSKGSDNNLVQIQGGLGQQIVGGRRPFMDEARVFPHDPLGDDASSAPDVESRGFVLRSLVEGLRPREYYSHAAGGREGIIDTGIKTSRTGYSTRRMACVTEGAVVSFTGAVFNQSILQGVLTSTLYGCDGLDASKLVRCFIKLHTIPADRVESVYLHGVPQEHPLYPKMLAQLRKDRALLQKICVARQDPSEAFMLPVDMKHVLLTTAAASVPSSSSASPAVSSASSVPSSSSAAPAVSVEELYNALFVFDPKRFMVYRKDTVSGRELNMLATRLFRVMLRTTLLSHRPPMSAATFRAVMAKVERMFERALVDPGEPVGLIATQSLMQSTMQATLNTFHTAGTGAGAAATGGLNYFDALISCQTPKVTTTTIVLSDPSKEFLVMDAVAPPVTMCDVVASIKVYAADGSDVPPTVPTSSAFSVRGLQAGPVRVVDFVLSADKMQSRCVRPAHLIPALAARVGANHVDVSEDRVRLYVPAAVYAYSVVQDVLDVVIKRPVLTPRGKNKNHRGVVNARRVRQDKIVIRDGALVKDSFVAIEVFGNFKLSDVYCLDGVDCARTWCNDVQEIQATLGTAATRQFMFRELFRTVTGSGSNVNPRFVMQVVDYMTWTGRIEPVTRHGMKLFGPMKSAAFEQPGKVLIQAALAGKTEHMMSPTANVMFGQEIRGIGTAIVDALPDPRYTAAAAAAVASATASAMETEEPDEYFCPFEFPVESSAPSAAAAVQHTATPAVACENPFAAFA